MSFAVKEFRKGFKRESTLLGQVNPYFLSRAVFYVPEVTDVHTLL